jgi:starch-binding outer membrane protein, SusD/RagB family
MTSMTAAARSAAPQRTGLRLTALLAGALALGGCQDLDIVNTNAPTVETLTGSPTRDVLALAATGIFSQTFNDVGTEIQFYALYGREGYNLLGNDPRETGEQIRGPQDPTGRNSGIWTGPYAAIRTINTYLEALSNATGLTPQEVRASEGFAKTMKAWHIHRLAVRTGQLGIPLDVDRPITAEPAPFVTFQVAMEAASNLMDEGLADLQAGSAEFPFTVAPGYTGFGSPSQFTRFNRALAAKILVHRATFVGCEPCWGQAAAALDASFITDQGLPEALALGVYYQYSSAAGEVGNPVSEPLANERLWVHASIVDGAQTRLDGSPDLRLTRKVVDSGRQNELESLVGRYKPILYNNPANPAVPDLGAPIPWISNEELLLLRAETRWHLGDRQGSLDDLDRVRIHSGGLEPTTLTGGSSTDAFVSELLYNRLYSLMWSQGTRWIDARRYNRLDTLPIDRPGDSVFENMLVPANECVARGLQAPCNPL